MCIASCSPSYRGNRLRYQCEGSEPTPPWWDSFALLTRLARTGQKEEQHKEVKKLGGGGDTGSRAGT